MIVDAQGHNRILLGTPAPASANRTRKDAASEDSIFLGNTCANRLATGQAFTPPIGPDRAAPPYDVIGMLVDDKENFAGVMLKFGGPKARDAAIELGADLNNTCIKINSTDGQPHAPLNFNGKNTPAWQFNDAAPAASARP